MATTTVETTELQSSSQLPAPSASSRRQSTGHRRRDSQIIPKTPIADADNAASEEPADGGPYVSPPKAARLPSHPFEAPFPALERANASTLLQTSLNFASRTSLDRQRSGSIKLSELEGPFIDQQPSHQYPPTRLDHDIPELEPIPPGPSPGLAAPVTHPRQFLDDRSILFKITFVSITCAAQFIAQCQFGMVIIPLTEIGDYLGVTSAGELSWMTASYGLTVGMFLISSGRLGDLYGPKMMWLLGVSAMAIFNVGTGFCKSRIPFDICRALAGVGAALGVPNAVAILGRTYPPGPTRSLIFAIFGALGPVGFMVGGVLAALLAQKASVPWIWFFTAIFAAAVACIGVFVLPPDDNLAPASARRSYDYVGTLLLVAALGLFNFTWNQGPLVGWSAPYVWSLLLVSILAFVALYFWERRVGNNALIPVEVLSRTSLLVYLCLWLGWMSFGVFLFYTTLFLRHVRGVSTGLGIAAQMSPVTPTGVICALAVPSLITRFPGHQIFFISMVSFLVGDLMAALAPVHGYWSVTFPSLILVILGPDLSFSTGQLIVSNSVDREFQGVAAGIVSMIANYSLSIGLGMAGTVEVYVAPHGPLLKGYRTAFWFGTGLAALAVVVVGLFVRMPKMAQYRE